jgi:hypothetical protein
MSMPGANQARTDYGIRMSDFYIGVLVDVQAHVVLI